MAIITEGDKRFLVNRAMPYFNLKALKVGYNKSKNQYPDIWVNLNEIPIITVTNEWRRQNMHERRKRLTHELLHCSGMQHDENIGYSTYPNKDRFSMKVYRRILKVTR